MKWFENLKITSKLLATFSVVIAAATQSMLDRANHLSHVVGAFKLHPTTEVVVAHPSRTTAGGLQYTQLS